MKEIDLVLTFKNDEGGRQNLKPKFFAENLDQALVKEAMDEMATVAHIFQRDNVDKGTHVMMYSKPAEAKYVETEEKSIF